jgi:hypothetical protein
MTDSDVTTIRNYRTWIMLSTRVLCFGLVGFALTGSQIAAGQSASSSKDPIAALVGKYDSSWDSKDTVAVSRLMAPRYQYFTSLGGVLSRAEMLSFLGGPRLCCRARKSL